jgi:hypothetical protein
MLRKMYKTILLKLSQEKNLDEDIIVPHDGEIYDLLKIKTKYDKS